MLASTVDLEMNSPLCKEMQGSIDDDMSECVDDIWADVNLAMLCKHLNTGANEQTHPWDPIIERSEMENYCFALNSGSDGHCQNARSSAKQTRVSYEESKDNLAQLLLHPPGIDQMQAADKKRADRSQKVDKLYLDVSKKSLFPNNRQELGQIHIDK